MSDPDRELEAAAPPANPQEERRAKRGRNLALALGLVLFVILVFIVTLVRLGANVLDRPV